MLPSWNSLHTLLVARAVLLWHGASYPMLRCSSLARHRILYVPALPCARYQIGPLFWYPIPVRIGSPTGDAWLTCQCASQSACSAFHNIRRLSLPSLAGEGTSHCAICWLRLQRNSIVDSWECKTPRCLSALRILVAIPMSAMLTAGAAAGGALTRKGSEREPILTGTGRKYSALSHSFMSLSKSLKARPCRPLIRSFAMSISSVDVGIVDNIAN